MIKSRKVARIDLSAEVIDDVKINTQPWTDSSPICNMGNVHEKIRPTKTNEKVGNIMYR